MRFRILSKLGLGVFFMAATACAGLAPAVAEQGPAPTVVAVNATGVAVVESVDQTARQILLRDASGDLLTVDVGPKVRNLAQVQPGDKVVIQLTKAVGVQLVPPGTAPPAPQAEQGAARAAAGQLPAGAAYQLVNTTVTFVSYDKANHQVTFTDPSGATHTIALVTPPMQHFASKLKSGQQVQVAYLQAISIAVQK